MEPRVHTRAQPGEVWDSAHGMEMPLLLLLSSQRALLYHVGSHTH